MPGRIELGSTTPRAGFEFCPIIPKFASLAEVPWGTRTPKKVALQEFLQAAPRVEESKDCSQAFRRNGFVGWASR